MCACAQRAALLAHSVQLSALSFELPTTSTSYPLTLTVHAAAISGDGAQYQPLGEWCDPVYVLLTLAGLATGAQLDAYQVGAALWLVGSVLLACVVAGVLMHCGCNMVLRGPAHQRRYLRTICAIRSCVIACALGGTLSGALALVRAGVALDVRADASAAAAAVAQRLWRD
mmetsp:Transcript_2537/g.6641  ORF Transcript_2537/g.6641 Transcript_2537/m.6641 type:complete len:171 (-) Transcript_2537:687-1199(-)